MSPDKIEESPEPEASGSVRLRLARSALEAALGVPGVLDADPGPRRLRVTADPPSGMLVGVSVTALPDGRYGVDLSLIAELVSLPELADEVRRRVLERAERDQVADVVGSINVEFPYVMTREEIAAAAASLEREAEGRVSEELAAAALLEAEAGAAAGEPAATAPTEAPDAVAAPGPTAAPVAERRGADPGAEASPPGAAVSAIAAQQAAIATDQAALAAKQAALAAEQAALAVGSEAVVESHPGSAGSGAPEGEGPGA
ncbi:MAG: hypothetical protein JO262_22055 [Solirubrobacterales bacterium]|nr:hypothetical protein [Solirubrobacterales bacterium]